VPLGLLAYRGLTRAAGLVLPRLWRPGPGDAASADDPWRGGFRGASQETARAAGSLWIHASSMGEVSAARGWMKEILARGYRPPFLFTTRTRTGLARARETWGDRVAARIAPHDLPQLVEATLADASPWRIDIIETELWPNLLVEAHSREIPVVVVGATVSERTTTRLLHAGVAGQALFGSGVFVLAQSDRHAERFRRLGVPTARVRVIGDLKAAAESPPGPRGVARAPFSSRPALVFGSLRPGEERAARILAGVLEAHRARGSASEPSGGAAGARGAFAGRARSLLVVAPRHESGEGPLRAGFERAGFEVAIRGEDTRGESEVGRWIESVAARPGRRVALLATRGELADAYEHAWSVVVGGTFAPYGGHNVWEPAARGCPVLVGPHHGDVSAAVDALRAEGGGVAVADERHLERTVEGWLADMDLELRGLAAARAASAAAGAPGRGMEAVEAWGLAP